MAMSWLVLIVCHALAAAHALDASTGAPACPNPTPVECTLRAAGVREPATMTASLLRSELRTVKDVAELDSSEAAELFDELRAAVVPLGDRSRLRKAAWGSGCSVACLHGGVLSMESTEERRATKVTERRQLQTSGGFSIEVAAIVFTGLIGMIGYVVQARSVQRATEAQTSLEHEAAEREKVEAKAGKQLERVQQQMALFVMPFGMANVRRRCIAHT